jgi:thiol:disulfide interchange protein DsbC
MNKAGKTIVFVGLMMASFLAAAAEIELEIGKKLEQKMGKAPGGKPFSVKTVSPTPVSNLYEIETNDGELIYTDKDAKVILTGKMIDTTSKANLTDQKLEVLNRVNFKDLPFSSAIKYTKGTGKRVIALFEDPLCGYCKRLRQTTLQEIDNVTVYVFQLDILSPDSKALSRNIWCSADRAKALDDWMLSNKPAAAADEKCMTTPHEQILDLGKKHRINAVPTLFFVDGSRMAGAMDLKSLEARLIKN